VLLLDTHTWLWMIADDPQLGKSARAAIASCHAAGALFLCPISLWEIALKSSGGKLELDMPLRPWMRRALDLTGVHIAAITPEIACSCAELPPEFHGDPADRIIAATARSEALTLITHDMKLLSLARLGYFKAIAT
jgi:PIN domain nuclease of toxin-antitoxin system